MAAAIGIDLGSYKAVMGVVKRKGIDIVLNDGSNRNTPVCVAYQAQERLIGDSVKTQIKRNFKNSVLFPTRFLGLNSQCTAQLELEKRYITHKLVNLPNNKIAFELTQAGNVHIFTPEQVLAFYLRKLHEFYVKDDVTTKDIVLSIPSYATNTERQALVDACDVAGFKCLRVINESTAIVYNYGFFRKNDLSKETERVVAFVDFGHSKTTVTIAGFKCQEARIICHKSDRNLGGRDLDYMLACKLGKEFAAKFKCDDPMENPRCRLRLYETIEKARKLMSGDTESTINIDYLMNEEDLNRKVTREEFETLIDPQMTAFTTLLRETITASGLSADQIHFVELVGDCTRTPMIQSICKQVFEKTELQRTLNSMECVARGASLNSAMMTPHFNVQQFTMEDYNNMPVSVNYQFTDLETGTAKDPKEYRNFFDLGQKFPLVQQLKFDNKEGAMSIKIDYSDTAQLMAGLPTTIAQYDVSRGTRKHAEVCYSSTKLAIRIKNNINQIPELERVEMTELWSEEEKIPVKTGVPTPAAPPKEEAKKDGAAADGDAPAEAKPAAQVEEQKYETKIRKKERTCEVAFKTVSHALPPDTREQFRGLENQLMAEDRKILDLKEAKYMLESFTYEMKNGVSEYGNFEKYIDPTLKQAFLDNLLATEAWIYTDGENAPLEEQRSRLEALQAVGNPIKMRYRFHNDFEDCVTIFNKYKTSATVKMAEIAHLKEEQRLTIQDKCQVLEELFMECRSEMDAKPKHEDISTTIPQLENKQVLLEAEVDAILATPAPAPQKEEVKKEETTPAVEGETTGEAQPAGDAEMKDEAKTEGEAESK